jgi:hypothetical protein
MTTTVAAMSEITRVAPWSLRALGYSFGVAERAVRFLAWAEAVHGRTLRTLRTHEQDITRSTSLPPAGRSRNGQRAWRIDAGGKYLLEVGPPAIDLLTCDVRTQGAGHIALANARGAGLLAALCDLAARRHIGCIAICQAGESDDLPYDVARLGWIAALPLKGRTLFLRGTAMPDDALILSVVRPWSAPVDGVDEPAIREDVGRVLDGLQGAYIGLSGFQPNPAVIEAQAALSPHALAGLHALDYADRVVAAYRSGVEMDLVDLAHLYELEKRTWAPTSERSRAQAGYGQY